MARVPVCFQLPGRLGRPATAPRTDLQQAASWLRQAEIDLQAMFKMASNSEGPFPCHAMTAVSLAALAAQVVDMALKSAMLRLQGLTHEIVGHHFSVLHRRLQHAAVRHTKEDLPGDVCDMEWLKSIYLATHPRHSSAHEVATQHQRNGLCMKDAKRAGVIARQIFDWVKALSESLQDIPGKGKGEARDTKVRELEEDGISSGGSSGSYGHDFEDDSPNSALETREIKETRRNQRMPVEVWTASELKEEALPKVSFMPAEPEEDVQPEETVLSQKNASLCRGTTEDVLDGLETVVQYTNMACRLRAKGLMPRAIRMMERALMISHRFGQGHPALALETCKVRLNFAAYLSESFRNREAIKAIKEAQESLGRLVQWAAQCPEESAAQALGQEACNLRCCALVAEAMALDLLEDGKPPPEEISEELKEMASVTISSMPADHPLRSLVRRALGSHTARPTGQKKKLPKKSVSNLILKLAGAQKGGEGPFAAPEPEPDVPTPETPVTPVAKQLKYAETPSRHKPGAEEQDVFKQYLRDLELARVAHLLSLSDDWEMQARKKLDNCRRKARFELELVDLDELKEKRYSHQGHKVFMQQLQKMNKSASDPNIRRAARKDKTAPETFHLKKLSRKIKIYDIYAKPVPATSPKSKVDQ